MWYLYITDINTGHKHLAMMSKELNDIYVFMKRLKLLNPSQFFYNIEKVSN